MLCQLKRGLPLAAAAAAFRSFFSRRLISPQASPLPVVLAVAVARLSPTRWVLGIAALLAGPLVSELLSLPSAASVVDLAASIRPGDLGRLSVAAFQTATAPLRGLGSRLSLAVAADAAAERAPATPFIPALLAGAFFTRMPDRQALVGPVARRLPQMAQMVVLGAAAGAVAQRKLRPTLAMAATAVSQAAAAAVAPTALALPRVFLALAATAATVMRRSSHGKSLRDH